MKGLIVVVTLAASFLVHAATYEANWESLNARPCPQWWKDAKFGIFIHWGIFSVPAFAPTDSKCVCDCYAEHYGNPGRWRSVKAFPEFHQKHHPNKSYSDLATELTAENFHPEEWASLIRRSGARYVVLTSKHHEGFALWPSKYTPYFNSMQLGAKRDLCGELSKAVKAAGLHMGFYYSLLEWRHPFFNKESIDKFVAEVNLPQLKELVMAYEPEIVWTDGEWDYEWPTWRGPEFLAWLYNESPVKDTVVTNDRWGKGFRGKCGDHYTTEYGGMEGKRGDDALLSRHPWEECRGIGHSFGYNKFETVANYLTNERCVEELVEKCSRGGNLLLNIGPDATGLIPVIMQERLLAIGKWLEVNGEAIYGTTAWKDRPATMRKDRVYFTAKGCAVYAIVFGSPAKIVVANAGDVRAVRLVGNDKDVKWSRKDATVEIEMPEFRQGAAPSEHAIVFKLERRGSVAEVSSAREIEDLAAKVEDLLDAKFLDANGVLQWGRNERWEPYREVPAGAEPLEYPGLCSMPELFSYENTGMMQGALLAAMSAKYRVTHDHRALAKCQRTFEGIRKVYELSSPGGKGFYCKPWGWRFHDETSSDQYVYTLAGLDAYHSVAPDDVKPAISKMIVEMVSWWVDRDYRWKYFGRKVQWEFCRFVSFVGLALKHGGGEKYGRELDRLLSLRDVRQRIPFGASIELSMRTLEDGTPVWHMNAEDALSGYLSVFSVLEAGPEDARNHAMELLPRMFDYAVRGLAPEGNGYARLVRTADGSYAEMAPSKTTVRRPGGSGADGWLFLGVDGPYRMGGQASAMGLNAIMQMAAYWRPAADWVDRHAEDYLRRIADGTHWTWFEDPYGILPPGLKWMTSVRSGDSLCNWLWAYWTLRERQANRVRPSVSNETCACR